MRSLVLRRIRASTSCDISAVVPVWVYFLQRQRTRTAAKHSSGSKSKSRMSSKRSAEFGQVYAEELSVNGAVAIGGTCFVTRSSRWSRKRSASRGSSCRRTGLAAATRRCRGSTAAISSGCRPHRLGADPEQPTPRLRRRRGAGTQVGGAVREYRGTAAVQPGHLPREHPPRQHPRQHPG